MPARSDPKKQLPRMIAIQISVVDALRDSGFLNAGTPFETASTPDRATAPEEKARIRRNSVIGPSVWPWSVSSARNSSWFGIAPRSWTKTL